jgi:hypothetical protein
MIAVAIKKITCQEEKAGPQPNNNWHVVQEKREPLQFPLYLIRMVYSIKLNKIIIKYNHPMT